MWLRRIRRIDRGLVLTLMRSTLLGWLLLMLISAFWPGQTSAMSDAGAARTPLSQGCAAKRLETQATAPIASSSDAADCGIADGSIADLAGDGLDGLLVGINPCRGADLAHQAPQSPSRIPASHWPEAPQRPPCRTA